MAYHLALGIVMGAAFSYLVVALIRQWWRGELNEGKR